MQKKLICGCDHQITAVPSYLKGVYLGWVEAHELFLGDVVQQLPHRLVEATRTGRLGVAFRRHQCVSLQCQVGESVPEVMEQS